MHVARIISVAAIIVGASSPAISETITFDNYLSPTSNDLANNFAQTGSFTQPSYNQASGSGITGGSVVGYSGNDYRATAVYTPSSFSLSRQGSTVSQSLDLFYNGQFVPLAPGANAVRSFRLGLLSDNSAAFETVGSSSVYMDGVYSLASNQLLLVTRSQTGNGTLTSTALAAVTLSSDHWYRLGATFTNSGNGEIYYSGMFADLGPLGTSGPISMASWDWTYQNADMSADASAFAAFSVLADGGFARADNFNVPTTRSVPGPVVGAGIPGLGTILVGIIGLLWHRRKQFA
jgi:hypothetical protein